MAKIFLNDSPFGKFCMNLWTSVIGVICFESSSITEEKSNSINFSKYIKDHPQSGYGLWIKFRKRIRSGLLFIVSSIPSNAKNSAPSISIFMISIAGRRIVSKNYPKCRFQLLDILHFFKSYISQRMTSFIIFIQIKFAHSFFV